jgi:hypothetical protein
MLLLHEMGLAARIPSIAVEQLVGALHRVQLKTFPMGPSDLTAGVDPYVAAPCHCQLGCVYQVLHACGVQVDTELPWIRRWLLSYQMADGGMSCDGEAYLVAGECPSSMVGTIGAFEAIAFCTPRDWTAEERAFLDRAAHFLMERQLRLGSSTVHNAEERVSAEAWGKLCFPRFYFYDVLRGLSALAHWAQRAGAALPPHAVQVIVAALEAAFGEGSVHIGRLGYGGTTHTRLPQPHGQPSLRGETSLFPLLVRVSTVGSASPFLSAEWRQARERLVGLGVRP